MTAVPNEHVDFSDYLEGVVVGAVQFKNWRIGQTAFNLLAEVRPDLAGRVRASDLDPFYADHLPTGHHKVSAFLSYVRENW